MRTIVFDLDGTLVDSAGDLQAAANRMLSDLSHPPLDRETIIGFIGRGVEVLVRRVLRHTGIEADEAGFAQALAAFRRYYDADLTTLTTLYPGARPLLETARARGLGLGICTNKPEGPARDICAELGIADLLDVIVGGDTLEVKKPDAGPLLHTIDLLGGAPSATLYIGDSETDYLTARAAAVPFVYFEGGYQRTPIADFRPDHRVVQLDEVAALLG